MPFYESEQIVVNETGRDYDFIATIVNKEPSTIVILFDDDGLPPLEVSDWVGILADEEGRCMLEAIANEEYTIEILPKEST